MLCNGRRAISMQGEAEADGKSCYLHHVVADYVSFATTFLLKSHRLTHAVAPPFRKKSRSLRLFACKRAHNISAALPTFCGFSSISEFCGGIFLLHLYKQHTPFGVCAVFLLNDMIFNHYEKLFSIKSLCFKFSKYNFIIRLADYVFNKISLRSYIEQIRYYTAGLLLL